MVRHVLHRLLCYLLPLLVFLNSLLINGFPRRRAPSCHDQKRVPVKEKVYDAASGKAKSTLRFEQQDKGPPGLKPNPASRPLSEALLFAHGKIHEVEHENVGVEGGHKGEELVERQTAKAIRSGIRHHKMKPYKAVEKAERQCEWNTGEAV